MHRIVEDSPSPKVPFSILPSSTLFPPRSLHSNLLFLLSLFLQPPPNFPFICSVSPTIQMRSAKVVTILLLYLLWKGFHFNLEKMLAVGLQFICHNVFKSLEHWSTAFDALRRLWLTPSPPLPALELSVDKCSSACFVPEISFYNGTCTLGHLFPGGQPHFTELLSVRQAVVQLCQFCLHLQYFQRVWSLNYFRRLEGSNPCAWLSYCTSDTWHSLCTCRVQYCENWHSYSWNGPFDCFKP